MRILIDGMRGFGDNIYKRGFVKTLAQDNEIHIATPWPELFADIDGIKFRKIATSLRTQSKNMARFGPEMWSHESSFDKTVNAHYGAGTNIPNDFARLFGCKPTWGLPEFKGPKIEKPYVIVRPATLRKEWFAMSRNPLPEYIDAVARWLSDRYQIISVADLEDGHEWLVGDAPFADIRYHAGELTMPELLGLCQGATAIVGGVGWIVPFCASVGVPGFIVMGGNGEYNAPEKLTNSTMDLSRLSFAMPDNFCRCKDMKHNCNKTNSNLKGQFDDWQRVL